MLLGVSTHQASVLILLILNPLSLESVNLESSVANKEPPGPPHTPVTSGTPVESPAAGQRPLLWMA